MIRTIATAAGVASFMLAAATAQASESSAVKQTVRTWLAKFNAGDEAGALALCADEGPIIDEFAPFRWSHFSDWFKAYDAYAAKNRITASKVRITSFAHVNLAGGRAYVVAPAVYTYTEDGKSRREKGTTVLTLEKSSAGWRIASDAWFGKNGVDAGKDASDIVDAARGFASMSAPLSPPPSAIVDEFAPYRWEGEGANALWYEELKRTASASGSSEMAIKLDAPSQLSVNGDKGYAVFPTVITSKVHGKPAAEHGAFAMAFEKAGGTWHIASWAWAMR